MSDGLREALAALVETHGGPDGYVMTHVLRKLLDRHPETDGGAPAPGGTGNPGTTGPTSEATATAAPSSPEQCHECETTGRNCPAHSKTDGGAGGDPATVAVPAPEPAPPSPVLSLDAVVEVLHETHRMHYAYGNDSACTCGWKPQEWGSWDAEHREHVADAIVALARSEQEVREQIATEILAYFPDPHGAEEHCDDCTILHDTARIARSER